jgi:kynurenine formamidase
VIGLEGLLGGRVYDLEQPRFQGAPAMPVHEPNFALALHRRHEPGTGEPRTGASGLLVMAEHSGTHIDALCHQAENLEMYGGVPVDASVQTPEGFTQLGIDTIAPLLARGVLLDCADAGHAVTAEDLERAAEGLEIHPGDVILVRTGTGALWEDREAFLAAGGIDASGSRWCAERQPLAVGADNMVWDVAGEDDPELGSLPGHLLLLVRAGVYIIEALNLEALARDRVREFAFVCLPLKLRGGTGSPVRPLALV